MLRITLFAKQIVYLMGHGTISDCTYFAAAIVAKKNPDYQEIINAFAFFKMVVRAKFPDAEIE